MEIKNLRGLRYPDDYLIRMFFKLGLDKSGGGKVLELGCGSGNNLLLFQEFGWDVTGIDLEKKQIEYAKHNLGCKHVDQLLNADLSAGMPSLKVDKFDALLIPSMNYYLTRSTFIRILKRTRSLMDDDCVFYIRSRVPSDWRWGKGEEIEKDGFILDRTETGEQGLLNVFYNPDDLQQLITAYIGNLHEFQCLRVSYENPQNDIVINNEDVVIWGRV